MDIGKEVRDKEFKGIQDVFSKIFKSDGVKGFYKGYGIALFGVGLYRASYFGCFDTFRPILFGKHSTNIF
jgi:solute carrier family 25 (mitochondrial adenine nucleotide translocator), member 4/5/6/31